MTHSARRQQFGQARRVATAAELAAANINPQTGLATDYLNHFNEAIMLLDMIPDLPDCARDFIDWRPLSYIEHFTRSHFVARDLAISAYVEADADVRAELDAVTTKMMAVLLETGRTMREVQHDACLAELAGQAAGRLRPLVRQAGGVINGVHIHQRDAEIDAIMGGAT